MIPDVRMKVVPPKIPGEIQFQIPWKFRIWMHAQDTRWHCCLGYPDAHNLLWVQDQVEAKKTIFVSIDNCINCKVTSCESVVRAELRFNRTNTARWQKEGGKKQKQVWQGGQAWLRAHRSRRQFDITQQTSSPQLAYRACLLNVSMPKKWIYFLTFLHNPNWWSVRAVRGRIPNLVWAVPLTLLLISMNRLTYNLRFA